MVESEPLTYFGTDSVDRVQLVMPRLKAALGVYPAWHGRYVCAPTESYNVDRSEVDASLALGQRMVFIYDGRAGEGYELIDEAAGRRDALIGMAVLSALCPGKKPLFMDDIESRQIVNLSHLLGFSKALQAADWPGGFYIPISQAVYSQTYGQLVNLVPRKYRLIWTAEWYNPRFISPPGPAWGPTLGAGIGDTTAPVMQQYNGEVPGLNVDYNIALPEAYNYMLAPELPRALVWHIRQTCALKPEPMASHTTKSVHTLYGGDIVVLTYKTQTVVSPLTKLPEVWSEVKVTGLDLKPHIGWVLTSNLYHD